jgi:alpha-beta hydrolase superfamily lysophospholipase
MTEQAMYLQIGGESTFTAYHSPAPRRTISTAVLIVPPFGWEDVASYRARRVWADHLATRGHHVVRIDLPGTGDSDGELNVPGRYETWRDAVLGAGAWLRDESKAPRLAVIGIGTGGYLAVDAVARGRADEAVLWATPQTGKRYLREFAAFSALEAGRIIEAGGPPPPVETRGLEAGGFVIDEDLAAGIASNDIAAAGLAPGARLLVLDRDAAGSVERLAEALVSSGLQVESGGGVGYAEMITRPDWSKPPRAVFELVDDWLARGDAGMPPASSAASVPPTSPTLVSGRLQERPFVAEHNGVALRGVLAEPAGGTEVSLTVVFVNAGAVRRTGPHRLWVETARRWAEQGVPSCRLDLEGIGDSDGDGEIYHDVSRFHEDRLVDQVRAGLDALVEHGLPPRFVVIGLCSGASWAFHSARLDARVAAAVMVNPRILYWHPNLDSSRALRRRSRGIVRSRTWRRLVRGKISIGRMGQFAASIAASVAGRLGLRAAESAGDVFEWQRRHAIAGFTSLRDAGRSGYFVFCDGEPLGEELAEDGLFDQPERWPNIRYTHVPGLDHTLSPVWMHPYAHRALDSAIRREVELVEEEK